jgi:hypothetical protein
MMKKTLSVLVASATLAIATSAAPTTAHARYVGCALGAGERSADAPRLCVPSLLGTVVWTQLLLVPHAGL